MGKTNIEYDKSKYYKMSNGNFRYCYKYPRISPHEDLANRNYRGKELEQYIKKS